MASEIIIWAANEVVKGLDEKQRQNVLGNLKNNRRVCEEVLAADSMNLVARYVIKTANSGIVHSMDSFGQDVVAYMCDEMFKRELELTPLL